jgi:uncharacterized membrane protein YgcG
MDKDFVEWMYLKTIVGDFEVLIQYYFSSMAYLAPWIRQAGVGLLYSLGLMWAAFTMLKAPVDRLLSAVGVFGMTFLAGFLCSPTTDTKNLGSASGTELSIGAYYSYHFAGSITQVFQDVLAASWKNSISEANGGGGPNKDAIAMAFNDKSTEFAEKFIKGEGKEAVKDYMQLCGSEALKQATTPKQKTMLRSIGVGANTLGMDAMDTTTMAQLTEKTANRNTDWLTLIGMSMGAYGGGTSSWFVARQEAKQVDSQRTEGEEFLKKLPPANSKIDGTKGYRIPTKDYYIAVLSDSSDANTSNKDSFKTLSGSSGAFQEMQAKGAETTPAGSEEDYVFYPKNCYDLYKVANETMRSLRQGAKGVPGYEKLGLTAAYASLSTANKARRGFYDQINADLKEAGINKTVDSTVFESLGDSIYSSTSKITNIFDKWMLEYGIPVTISTMAMIVALLLTVFPIFAMISVMFGPKVLISYFKFMAFPFIVVFINNFMLSMSANLITFSKAYAVIPETFMPGSVDAASSISAMSAETIIYASICVCEIAIAKFILWDDVRAVTSFNPAQASKAAASRGASMIGSAISLVAGVFARGARMAKAAEGAKGAKGMSHAISDINRQVTDIAGGGRPASTSPIQQSSGGGSGGNGPDGTNGGGGGSGSNGGTSGSGGNSPLGGSNSLNPPPPEPKS